MIVLKPFQEKGIEKMRKTFLELIKNDGVELIFKSPTGSGKTVMVAQFLKDMANDPQLKIDKSFIWLSFSEDSCMQSKDKLKRYYGGANEMFLSDVSNLKKNKKLERNEIFFINWQKIKTSSKEGRLLRKPNESTEGDYGIFDEMIFNTKKDGRIIILLVDEAHRETDTELAEDILKLISPRIIIKITATPKKIPNVLDVEMGEIGFVNIKHEEVIEAQLIKEKIVTQTKEDIEKIKNKEIDQDELLLELAISKKKELEKIYGDLKIDVNPIVLIQLPNDDVARRETLNKTKEMVVRDYLSKKSIDEEKIATWLSGKKINLEDIEKNNSEIDYLIFKHAPATGWDCPRASILVMFREIKDPKFKEQILGRIIRMPEAKHYCDGRLNKSYLYTNYERNQIMENWKKSGINETYIYKSERKKDLETIKLKSVIMGRTDYNDLGISFQKNFEKIANKHFKINEKDSKEEISKKLSKINTENIDITSDLLVNAEIEDYDNFIEEIRKKGEDIKTEISKNDLERMYDLLCFNLLAKQEDENKRFAPVRSWSKLKKAINVWLEDLNIHENREGRYKIIVKDLLKEDSEIKKVVSESLASYKPIREKEIQKKSSRSKQEISLELPQNVLEYSAEYELVEKNVSKNTMEKFYQRKEYLGKKNETDFIKYIDKKKSVKWWHKNGDEGSEHFAIVYYDKEKHRERLFYPDWIILLENGIKIITDSKAGETASSLETKEKAEALQKWIKDQKDPTIIGGISVKFSEGWKINRKETYNYDNAGKDFEYFDTIVDEMKL
jgi:type III restriction enzyme